MTTKVIFVHGLGGDSSTWGKFESLIKEDDDLDAAVEFFEYPSPFLGIKFSYLFQIKFQSIENLAESLRTYINQCHQGSKEIILVGHSMGGLIIRQYLLDEKISGHVLKVKKAVLYAVPNQGAKFAKLAKNFLSIYKNPHLIQLSSNSDFIKQLNRNWINSRIEEHVDITIVVAGNDKIVTIDSAKSTFEHLLPEQITGVGHLDIVQPNLHSDLSYLILKNKILEEIKTDDSLYDVQNQINSTKASELLSCLNYPKELIDKEIEKEIKALCKSRFFVGFDRVGKALELGKQLSVGNLVGGSYTVKSIALAWCSRILSLTDELDKAKEYLNLAKTLTMCQEIKIAEAFISSKKGDKNAALKILADIDSPSSRSASLMIVNNHEGKEKAIDWFNKVKLEVKDLEPDGKYFLLSLHLELGNVDSAKEILNTINDQDLENAPVLHCLMAMTHLLGVVPIEFRALVFTQLPFDDAVFSLASSALDIEARRKAKTKFTDATNVARQLNCSHAATVSNEYALWLELMDPENGDQGMKQLKKELRDPKSSLRLVNLGIQFGIDFDLVAIEKEIEQQIALHGGITPDAAIARLALASTQKTPEDVANYITKYFEEFSKHLNTKAMRFIQIEMFSKANLSEKAKECLDILKEEGLLQIEEDRLNRIIAEAEGADPIQTRENLFMQSGSLLDLKALVNELEFSQNWDDLCKYGELLFEKTGSISDAERLVIALSKSYKSESIVKFCQANTDLLQQSKQLKMSYSWALFHEGALVEARNELKRLSDESENPVYRNLQINLGISLGDWNYLLEIVKKDFINKDKRSAEELMSAGQVAIHLNSPYAKDLIFAAVEKGSDDPKIMTAAYF